MNNQNIFVRLSSNVAQFKAQMGVAAAAVRQAGVDAAGAATKADVGTKKIAAGMVAVGAAATAMAAASAAAAIQLETRMQNVATIWDQSAMSIETAGRRVLDMSLELPQSAANLAEGLYDVASSGFQGAAALEVLQASARAASAGLTDTATAARGITAVLNAYGLTADAAATVSDVLFQTVNLGVVTFEQLANTMGDFVGSASVAGVTIEDANAALATMTLSGISASEAGTSLNRVLQEFIQPGEALTKVLLQMGYATGLEAIEAEGLQGVMMRLQEATGGNATMMAQLFPEIRGLRGALALLSAEGENYARVAGLMTDETELIGATQRALEEQQKSTSYQFTILKNTVMESAISFGQSLLPAIKWVVGAFQTAIDIWNAVPSSLQTIIGVTVLLGGVLTGLAGAFVLLSPAIVAASGAWGVFTAAVGRATTASLAFLATPWGAALGVAAVAVAGLTALWAKHKAEQADTKRRVDELKDSLDSQTGAITTQTEQLLRQRIVEEDLVAKSAELGVSLEDLAAAMMGDEAAARRVNDALDAQIAQLEETEARTKAASGGMHSFGEGLSDAGGGADKLRDSVKAMRNAIGTANSDIKDAEAALNEEKAAAKATEGALASLQRQNLAKAESDRIAAEAARAHADMMDSLAASLSKAFDPSAAVAAAEESYSAAGSAATDRLKQQLADRHDAQREHLDDVLELEVERWERSAQLRQDALEKAQKDELDALEATHEAALALLEDRHEEENRLADLQARERKNALDDAQRAEKNALDDSIRLQRRAMDARIAVIDEEYNQRKKRQQKSFEAQKEELEWIIRTTWGAQRQAAIARLANLEEENDATLAAMEQERDAVVQLEKDTQSDAERAQKQGLDDRHRTQDQQLADDLALVVQHLKDRQDAETQAEKDRYDQLVEAHKVRHGEQKRQLDDDLRQQKKAMEDDHEERRKHLERVQNLENTKADERRGAARGKHQLSLSELKTQLDESNRAHEEKLGHLVTIWERSGRNLSQAMLDELAALDPKVVEQLANTGDASFDGFMDSFGRSVEGVDPTVLATKFKPWTTEIRSLLDQVGQYGGAGMMESVAKGIANDPTGAQRVRDILAQLMAPKEISPGVYAVPAPGGGYRPVRMTFADGGEYHVAQYAPPGAWRVWAEPETGGESYIPWALSKRPRSLAVLAQTAHAFGYSIQPMADGGVLSAMRRMADAQGSVMNHVEVQVRVAAGVDPDAVGVAVRREVERAFDTLARQVAVKSWRN